MKFRQEKMVGQLPEIQVEESCLIRERERDGQVEESCLIRERMVRQVEERDGELLEIQTEERERRRVGRVT